MRVDHAYAAESEPFRPDTRISSDVLKILAMALMLIDHIGAFVIDHDAAVYGDLRTIGRLAFPIFCFLIAEGAHYTRSMPRYMAKMAVFAVISTPPYNLVHGSEWYSCDNPNVFFTLFLGLAAIYSITALPKAVYEKMGRFRWAESKTACALLGLPLCALCYMTASWLGTDYGEYGVAAILLFWLLRKKPAAAWVSFAVLTFVFYAFLIKHPDLVGGFQYARVNLRNVVTKLLFRPGAALYYYRQRQLYAVLAFVPCMLYNGKRGTFKGKVAGWGKYLFYAFYPVHLWCLWLVQLVIQ